MLRPHVSWTSDKVHLREPGSGSDKPDDVIARPAPATLEARGPDQELARLLELERTARQAAESAHARALFLSRASALFMASLAYEATLGAVASAAVPAIADWCAVDLVTGAKLSSVAVAHVDPAKLECAKELRRRYGPLPGAPIGAMTVIQTGVAELYTEVPESLLAANVRDAEQLRVAQELGFRSAMVVPIKERGRPIGAITFVISESARRYAADELMMAVQLGELAGTAIAHARLYDEARAAARLNEMFSGVVGHDLRNPLASIMAAAHLVLARDPDPADVQPLERILASSERMARMIDQLLDFTRVRAGGGIPSDPQPMDLVPVCRQVIDEIQAANPERTIQLASRGPLTGVWDTDRLAQLVSNLVSNAVQHGRGDVPVTIEADGTRANAIEIRVSNGGAVPADLIPVIFEPFRGTHYRRTRATGLGLGLYIAQQIALVHGGTIELTCTAPDRTTFTVILPRANHDER